jgi:hypothetical protein
MVGLDDGRRAGQCREALPRAFLSGSRAGPMRFQDHGPVGRRRRTGGAGAGGLQSFKSPQATMVPMFVGDACTFTM